MKKILLVEDEASVASFINKGLAESGYSVSVAFDGKMATEMAFTNTYDVIVLDIMLPGMNGLEVCRTIRKENRSVPILFLTALGTSENIVAGFESEADDYLVKPFKFVELEARIKSLLRRTQPTSLNSQPDQRNKLQVADLELDDYTKTVRRGDKAISLTSTEYRLLYLFLKNTRRVLSRMEILEAVWGVNFDMGTNVVDVYVNYLRKKIDTGKSNKLIHTVIGMGYVLKEPDANTN